MSRVTRTLVVSLTAVAAVAMTAGTAEAATWYSTDKWATWSDGGYTVRNDVWGGGAGPQTIWANSYSNFGVWADHPNTGGVKSYPHSAKNVGRSLGSLRSVTSDFTVSRPGAGAYETPSARGTWPAFWLTGATSWPPESDILEFKGDARNWFNTYRNASGGWSNTVVGVNNPGAWHGYRAWITKVNASDVDIHYYLDGNWVGQHRGANFAGKPMWLIINLQMEGSSGAPGPTSATYYRARNVYVGRNRA